jgi:FkbM family methyltransferase
MMQRFWKYIFDCGRELDLFFKERKKKREWSKWLNLFKDVDFIQHQLSNNLKINLHKNSILAKCIYYGFEENEISFLNSFLREGDVFFDIGSNIGLFSLHASVIVGKNGRVIAFEPAPDTYKKLIQNIKLNSIKNILPLNIGLSDKTDFLKLNVSNNGYDAWNSFALLSNNYYNQKELVEVSTLDFFIQKNDISKINLIKLDVEGWELFVIRGGENYIKEAEDLVLLVEFTEENAFAAGYYVHEIYDLLKQWGYQWYSFANGKLKAEDRRLHYPYDNFIAAKNFDLLSKRLGID